MVHIPIRTCVGCLRKRPKSELLRFVVSKEGLKTGNVSGRGFYLCPDRKCFEMAMKRRGFAREVLGSVSPADFERVFVTSLENTIDSTRCSGVISFDGGGVALG